MFRNLRAAIVVVGGIAILGGVILYLVSARPAESPVYGRDLYLRYCASCHGVAGKGDGPAAEAMDPRPTDLTRLRERYGGQHPLREIMSAIDGRRPVRAHGDSDMPVWGIVFEQEKEDKETRWPKRTTLLQVRLIADYVLTLQ